MPKRKRGLANWSPPHNRAYDSLAYDGSDEDVRRWANLTLLCYRKRPLGPGDPITKSTRATYEISRSVYSNSHTNHAAPPGNDLPGASSAFQGEPMTITITHTRQQGTLVYGTVQGDGAGKVLSKYNFRGSRNLPFNEAMGEAAYWYLPHSRRRHADRWKIKRAIADLKDAGFDVADPVIDNTTPAVGFDDLENERYERAADRAERYIGKAARDDGASEAIRARNKLTYDALNGTPILIGHYSEKRHRNLLDRLWKSEGKAWALYDKAKEWRSKADAADRFQHRREAVGTTQRRIEKLEKRLRKIAREMDGRIEIMWDNPHDRPGPLDKQLAMYTDRPPERVVPVTELSSRDNEDGTRNVRVHFGVSEHAKAIYAAEVTEIVEEISYWELVIEASGVKIYSKANVAKGDFIKTGAKWIEVLKVSAKSVTVPDRFANRDVKIQTLAELAAVRRHVHTSTVPYDEIGGVLTREEAEAQFPDAFAALLEGQELPKRTAAKRGTVKLETHGGHNSETWWFTVGENRYLASWTTPDHAVWYGPPTPIADPAPIVVRKSTGLGESEPVTEIAVPAGAVRWREDVQNVLRAWVEPWAAQQLADADKGEEKADA